MCIITTSYPCPEPNMEELLHRLKNTRKISPCVTVRSNGGRPSSCTGEVRVQHHHLGQSEFCSWCSFTAKLKYVEMKDGTQLKRKAGSLVSGEERGEGSEGSTAKKIKAGTRGEAREAELKTGKHDVVGQDVLSQDEAVRKRNQTNLLGIAKETLDTENVAEEPIVGLRISTNSEAALNQPIESVCDSAKVISEAGKHCEEIAANAPSLELATKISDAAQMTNEAGDLDEDGTQVENTSNRASAVRKEKAKPTGSPKATLAKVSMPKAPCIEDKMMTEHEESQSIFEKINQDLINAAKGYADVLKQNTALLKQLSEHKDEINGLKTALLQQNAQNLAEANKKKDVVKDVESQKATMKLEKQDLEVKVGRLIQKIDELTKATSAANEETTRVKARIRGQQNRVAELEGQITFMKQVEDGREKQLDETLRHNEVLQRQNAGLKVKNANSESELLGLRRDIATIGAENSQLRGAVVEMVLSTPVPQGTPTATGSPAAKGEDVKME